MTQPDLFSAKTEWFDIEVARGADLNRVLADAGREGWAPHAITWPSGQRGARITGRRPIGSKDLPDTFPTQPRVRTTKTKTRP
jgi:hypothetical protein